LEFSQTRKFFIKVLVHNESVLSVRTSEFEAMGYSLKRDSWLNSFVDVNNQSMRRDGVPWRGAREKRPEFYSILFSALTDKNDIIMDWQCGIGVFFVSLLHHFSFLLSDFFIFCFFQFPLVVVSLTFHYLVLLGGSVIACRSIHRHIVALESDIDIFRSILLPMRELDHEQSSQKAAPPRGAVFAPPPRKMAKRNFDLLCA
jgi:hypothetical protein